MEQKEKEKEVDAIKEEATAEVRRGDRLLRQGEFQVSQRPTLLA